MKVGELVTEWMKTHQKQYLAEQVGCSSVTLNKKIRGEVDWTLTEATVMAETLGVSLEEFNSAAQETRSA